MKLFRYLALLVLILVMLPFVSAGRIVNGSLMHPPTDPVCVTEADINQNGNIDMTEMIASVNAWKSGSLPMSDLIKVVNLWKAGSGC